MKTTIKVDNRINQLFNAKKQNILSVYFTAGYPELDNTTEIIKRLAESGVDLIEIGIPFSDPVADGPTIQSSNQQALENGMTLSLLFKQLKNIRKDVDIPLILMGYLNPIMQFGITEFCEEAAQLGIDGLIIPDLPMLEYQMNFKNIFDSHGLHNIFLISPQTHQERIVEIDNNTEGFIYMVSSASITGAKSGITEEQEKYFERITAMNLKNPTLIGFGISDNNTFKKACTHANGAIIGSAFIKALNNEADLATNISTFIGEIKN